MRKMFWATIVLVGGMAAPVRADDGGSTRDVANQLAKKVREVAGGLKPAQTAVRIGQFTGSQDLLALGGGGGGFMAELEIALVGFVEPAAPLELQGSVFLADDPATAGLKVIKVKAKLVDKNGDEPAEFKEFVGFVRRNTDIVKFAGGTVSFKPDSEYKDGPPSAGRNKDFQKALPPSPGKPPEVQAFVDGSLVRTRKDSPYAIEIRKKPLNGSAAAKAEPAVLKDGLAFVPIDRGEVYEVVVLNSSNHEIAVSLSLDGIDQFTFSRDRIVQVGDKEEVRALKDDEPLVGRPRFSQWIVSPAEGDQPRVLRIRGWHWTADQSRKDNALSFLVTEYGKGAASKFPTLAQGKIGTITVGIAHCFPKDSSRSGTETGFGPPVEVKQTVVQRKIEAPHEFVTIRYNR